MELITTKKDRNQSKGQRHLQKANPDLSTMVYGKVPPQARELEEAVLGAIMLEKNAFELVSEILKAESFYVDVHQRIFRAFTNLSHANGGIDIMTVVEELRKNDELDIIGGPYAIAKLTNSVTSSAHIEDHAKIIQEKFLKREIIRMGSTMIADGYEDSTDAFELLDQTEQDLFDISSSNVRNDFSSTGELAAPTITRIEFLMNNRQELTGVTSGFRPLDAITGGWQPTDLIVLAARPSVGKTAFALNLARNAAMHPVRPIPVGIFSLEMSNSQLMNRLISSESKVHLEGITRGRLDPYSFDKVKEGTQRLSDACIFIDDAGALNIFELRAKARRMVSRHQVGMIIIDYLQLMSGTDARGNREQEISKISRGLKLLAKDLHVPVIALSQMSREIEKRSSGIPVLSDLRESGAIEQDADFVGFLYRPDYQQDPNKMDPSMKNDAYLKIAKHRNGALETLAFHTDLGIQTWFDPDGWREHTGEDTPAGNWKRVSDIKTPSVEPVPNFYETNNPDDGVDDMPF